MVWLNDRSLSTQEIQQWLYVQWESLMWFSRHDNVASVCLPGLGQKTEFVLTNYCHQRIHIGAVLELPDTSHEPGCTAVFSIKNDLAQQCGGQHLQWIKTSLISPFTGEVSVLIWYICCFQCCVFYISMIPSLKAPAVNLIICHNTTLILPPPYKVVVMYNVSKHPLTPEGNVLMLNVPSSSPDRYWSEEPRVTVESGYHSLVVCHYMQHISHYNHRSFSYETLIQESFKL